MSVNNCSESESLTQAGMASVRPELEDLERRIALVLYPEDWEPPTQEPDDRDKRWVAAGAAMLARQVLHEIESTHHLLIRSK
jgi:hypothetical protein